MLHLAGPLASIATAVVFVIFLLWFCICFPTSFAIAGCPFSTLKPCGMWLTIISLFFIYGFGSTGLNKVIFSPKPREKKRNDVVRGSESPIRRPV